MKSKSYKRFLKWFEKSGYEGKGIERPLYSAWEEARLDYSKNIRTHVKDMWPLWGFVFVALAMLFLVIIVETLDKNSSPEFYCTTEEYKILSEIEICGYAEEYSEDYGGLIKIKGKWLNTHWLENICDTNDKLE